MTGNMKAVSRRNRLLEVLSGKNDNYLYPFFWQHGESRETLEGYIEKIKESGCGAFCLESRPHPDFLGDGWWRDLGIILDKARELDMKVWILDDSHFPTGYANGRVKEAPENLRQWFLVHKEMDIPGPVRNGRIAIGPFAGEKHGLVDGQEKLVSVVLVKRTGDGELSSDGRFWNLTGEVQEGWLALDLPKGHYRIFVTVLCQKEEGPFQDYIDMTNPESVRLLVDEAYEKHYQHFGEEFGRTITGFFSDEPGFYNAIDKSGYSFDCQIGSDMHLPWNSYIEETFCKKLQEQGILDKIFLENPGAENLESVWKERVRAILPCLWFPCGEYTEEIRAAYMDALTTLYQQNFTGQLADWCRAHGVEYVGHVIEDNNIHCRLGAGPGHYFRALGGQDMAGIDVVLQQVLPGQDYLQFGMSSRGLQDGAFNYYGLGKLGASLAHQAPRARGRAMCEIYGAYGWGEGIGLMKWLADHMLVRGINVFVPHAFSERAFPDPDCPPHFYAHGYNPQYEYLKELFPYMNRMCHLFSGGRPVIKVGIVYHGEAEWLGRSVYFHTIGQVLMRSQIDYDLIWMDQFENTVVEDGVIRSGLLELSCLLVPLADRYPSKVKHFVDRCVENGVQVYQVLDELPEDSRAGKLYRFPDSGEGERMEHCPQVPLERLVSVLAGNYREMEWETDRIGEEKKEPGSGRAGQENPGPWLKYYHYEMEDGRHAYMLFQESVTEGISGRVRLPVMEGLQRYDGLANTLQDVVLDDRGRFFLELFPGEAVVLLAGNGKLCLEERKATEGTRDIKAIARAGGKKWKRPRREVRISVADYGRPGIFEEVGACLVESLSSGGGISEDFCGTIRYETELDMEQGDLGILDLGRCREAARVWVNGQDIGISIGEPYYFDMADTWSPGRNQIRVEVPTTLVHALCDSISRNMVLYLERLEGPIRYL